LRGEDNAELPPAPGPAQHDSTLDPFETPSAQPPTPGPIMHYSTFDSFETPSVQPPAPGPMHDSTFDRFEEPSALPPAPEPILHYSTYDSFEEPSALPPAPGPIPHLNSYMIMAVPFFVAVPFFPAGEQEKGVKKSKCRGRPQSSREELLDENKTTIMMRHLPNNYTREMVVQLLNDHNFKGKYDFVYLPYDFSRDFSNPANYGYAFINFVSNEEARRAWSEFSKFDHWISSASKKVCDVDWSPLQGKDEHVKRYRDSSVMHHEVPDCYKPAIYDQNGNQMQFPKSLKSLHRPRLKNSNNVQATFPCS